MYATHRPRKFLVVLIAATLSLGAYAQAKKTATRSAEFDAFGGFSYANSAYQTPRGDLGGTLGADYTQFLPRYKGLIIPSFQIRGTLESGPSVDEKTIEGGIRLASTYKRIHPYGDILGGLGVINFNHPTPLVNGTLYKRDSTFIYVFGGGVTVDTKSNFSAMVDYQQQYWDLGEHPPNRFYPYTLTLGVVYHIPFKPFKTR